MNSQFPISHPLPCVFTYGSELHQNHKPPSVAYSLIFSRSLWYQHILHRAAPSRKNSIDSQLPQHYKPIGVSTYSHQQHSLTKHPWIATFRIHSIYRVYLHIRQNHTPADSSVCPLLNGTVGRVTFVRDQRNDFKGVKLY